MVLKGVLVMKRKVFNLGLGLLSCFIFFSCLEDGADIYVSYGVIKNVSSSNNYEIITDKGNTLVVTRSNASQDIENDKRVLVNFEILSDKDKSKNLYEIKVNGFYNLLSKPLINESFILQDEEVRRDSIGDDPYNAISARFGGDYINIDFEIFHSQRQDNSHLINLVYDDTRVDADTIYIRLYHNAFDEIPEKGLNLYRGYGRCSYKISELLPQDVNSKAVQLTWTEYDRDMKPVERSRTGVFKKGEMTDSERNFTRATGIDSFVNTR